MGSLSLCNLARDCARLRCTRSIGVSACESARTQLRKLARLTSKSLAATKSVPVENASVYVKYIEERTIRKDKKLEFNVKTNREGFAHVPEAPIGRALIQIIAEGWKTYGRWYDITDPQQIIKVRLEKPPKWY